MLCKSCRSSHTEHNKIGFAIFGFFCDFISNFQVTGKHTREKRIIPRAGPWNFLKPHKNTLALHHRPWNKFAHANGSLVQPAAVLTGFRRDRRRSWPGRWENDQGLTTGPMVAGIGVGTAPVRGLGRGRRWAPLELGRR
jgi:hypothetical protein